MEKRSQETGVRSEEPEESEEAVIERVRVNVRRPKLKGGFPTLVHESFSSGIELFSFSAS